MPSSLTLAGASASAGKRAPNISEEKTSNYCRPVDVLLLLLKLNYMNNILEEGWWAEGGENSGPQKGFDYGRIGRHIGTYSQQM